MTKQKPDPNLKGQDYRKWVEGQSTKALEKELRTLELRLKVLQNRDPEMEAQMKLQQQEQEAAEWDRELELVGPEERAQLAAEIDEEMENMKMNMEREAKLAAMEPEKRAQLLGEIDQEVLGTPSWLAEQVEVTQHLEAVRRELTARRTQELSKGEAASASVKEQNPPKPSVAELLSKYRSHLRRAIASKTLSIPNVSYRKVCNALDKDKELKLSPQWKKFLANDLFVQVLAHKSRRRRVEKEIDKVWAYLRRWGYPPHRTRHF